jgi:hypothetical protein
MLERTDLFRQVLRRYTYSNRVECQAQPGWGHDASVQLEPLVSIDTDLEGAIFESADNDPRWPTKCAACDYVFTDEEEAQSMAHRLYRKPCGTLVGTRDLDRSSDAGAMWFVPWYDQIFKPQLEHCLVVLTPGGEWVVDSQATNCTIADDRGQEGHHCWSIEGTLPKITVGKRGPTCGAGAGSILCGTYHGFLRNGRLEAC